MYDVTAIAGAGRLMALLKTSSSSNAVGRNGSGRMAGDASYNSIQFDSIRFETEFEFDFNCQLPIGDVASNQRATCNLSLSDFIFGSTSE